MAEALLAMLFVGGWIVIYVTIRRVIFAEIDELRTEIYEHTRIEAKAPPLRTETKELPIAAPPVPVVASVTAPKTDEISGETLAVISAAVAALLGKRAHVRQARMLPSYGISPWAQQGRVFIQASHNLILAARSRG